MYPNRRRFLTTSSLALAAASIALLWAWAALSLARPPVPARTLGWTQVLAGLLVVAATAAGYHLGW